MDDGARPLQQRPLSRRRLLQPGGVYAAGAVDHELHPGHHHATRLQGAEG